MGDDYFRAIVSNKKTFNANTQESRAANSNAVVLGALSRTANGSYGSETEREFRRKPSQLSELRERTELIRPFCQVSTLGNF